MVVRDIVDVLGRDRYPGSAMGGLKKYLQLHPGIAYIRVSRDPALAAYRLSELLSLPLVQNPSRLDPRRVVTTASTPREPAIIVTQAATSHYHNGDYLLPAAEVTPHDLKTLERLTRYYHNPYLTKLREAFYSRDQVTKLDAYYLGAMQIALRI